MTGTTEVEGQVVIFTTPEPSGLDVVTSHRSMLPTLRTEHTWSSHGNLHASSHGRKPVDNGWLARRRWYLSA